MGEVGLAANPRLDLYTLESDVQRFLEAGIAQSTMKVYRAGWSRYQTFATQFTIDPIPITLEKVTLFIAHLGSQGLAASTIEAYLAGLRYFQIQANPACMAPSFHTSYINLIIKFKQILHAWPHHSTLLISTSSSRVLKGSMQQRSWLECDYQSPSL